MNPVIGDICQQHLQFMKWADNLMLAAVQTHMPERKETLEHIFMAERIWLARVQDAVNANLLVPPPDLPALASEWSELAWAMARVGGSRKRLVQDSAL